MGTTVEKLIYLQETKEAIKNAIVEKGVEVPEGTTFRGYAEKIGEIPEGAKTAKITLEGYNQIMQRDDSVLDLLNQDNNRSKIFFTDVNKNIIEIGTKIETEYEVIVPTIITMYNFYKDSFMSTEAKEFKIIGEKGGISNYTKGFQITGDATIKYYVG